MHFVSSESPLADPTQAALDRLLLQTGAELERHAQAVGSGAWGPTMFGDRMLATLTDAHARAAYLGRFRAGDTTPPDADDRRFAEEVVRTEDEFLAAFEEDLASGRYTDEQGHLDTAAIARRARMYLGRVAGTANETFALASDGPIYWRLGSPEQHCPDCPRLAAGSPYTADSLPVYPKSNQTACMFHCGCFLEREDGVRSFTS